ncbi:uncharacterized protein METZ01_LOCUS228649 [marine metagenome]|uniref:Uncharacterized protein n=1 Tax=marine metagenome TaxID=408172 RepID=A0A382GLZ1_9ZZZZ
MSKFLFKVLYGEHNRIHLFITFTINDFNKIENPLSVHYVFT